MIGFTISETIICKKEIDGGVCECDADKQGEDCIIQCHGLQVCKTDELKCRDGDKCTISCHGREACTGAIITCGSNADCDLLCTDGGRVCNDVKNANQYVPFVVNLNDANAFTCAGKCGETAGIPADFSTAPTIANPTQQAPTFLPTAN